MFNLDPKQFDFKADQISCASHSYGPCLHTIRFQSIGLRTRHVFQAVFGPGTVLLLST